MDKNNDNILETIGRRSGMTVPEGYFDNFVGQMIRSLPEQEQPDNAVAPPMTRWQRIRPYAYMAAMFAGVWCMMKMFSMMGEHTTDLSIENNKVMTAALSNDEFVYDYIYSDIDSYDLLEDMYKEGLPVDDLAIIETAFSDEPIPDTEQFTEL